MKSFIESFIVVEIAMRCTQGTTFSYLYTTLSIYRYIEKEV